MHAQLGARTSIQRDHPCSVLPTRTEVADGGSATSCDTPRAPVASSIRVVPFSRTMAAVAAVEQSIQLASGQPLLSAPAMACMTVVFHRTTTPALVRSNETLRGGQISRAFVVQSGLSLTFEVVKSSPGVRNHPTNHAMLVRLCMSDEESTGVPLVRLDLTAPPSSVCGCVCTSLLYY